MNGDAIFEVVKANVLRVLPEVRAEDVTPDKSLVELGANSVDRVEVSMYSMEALKLRIPRVEFHGVRNLAGLVRILQSHLGES
jgi:polyketide biosynthesis acyl carrier protein